MNRNSTFSFRCQACGRCCANKRIQANPYEILRLARNREVSTGALIGTYIEADGPYLCAKADGGCLFQEDANCLVHKDRPLACRTYPLGRWVRADGHETFRLLKPHPQCPGVFGREGTVGTFLEQQGTLPYLEAADRYQALFYRLFDALQDLLRTHADLPGETRSAMIASGAEGASAWMRWLDVDHVVETGCNRHTACESIENRMAMHMEQIENLVTRQQERSI